VSNAHFHDALRVVCEMQDDAAAFSRFIDEVVMVIGLLADFGKIAEDGGGPHQLTIEVTAPGFGQFPWAVTHKAKSAA